MEQYIEAHLHDIVSNTPTEISIQTFIDDATRLLLHKIETAIRTKQADEDLQNASKEI